jgi:hypothetical protein
VSRYFNLHKPPAKAGESAPGKHPAVDATARQALQALNVVPTAKARHGDKSLEVLAAAVLDVHGAATWEFEMMHRALIRVLFHANAMIRRPSVGIQIHDRMGNLVFAAGTPQLRFPLPALAKGQEIILDFQVTLSLQPGVYTLSLDAAEVDADNPNLGVFYDRIGGLGPLTVTSREAGALPFYGIAQLAMDISYG